MKNKKILSMLKPWDILINKKDKNKLFVFFVWNDENWEFSVYAKNIDNNNIVKIKNDEFLKENYSYHSHIEQENDFYDKKWNLLRKWFLFNDEVDEEADEEEWIETITVLSGSESELSYSPIEFKEDCEIIIEKNSLKTLKNRLNDFFSLENESMKDKIKKLFSIDLEEEVNKTKKEIEKLESNPKSFFS